MTTKTFWREAAAPIMVVVGILMVLGGAILGKIQYDNDHPVYCSQGFKVVSIDATENNQALVTLENGQKVRINEEIKVGDLHCNLWERKP